MHGGNYGPVVHPHSAKPTKFVTTSPPKKKNKATSSHARPSSCPNVPSGRIYTSEGSLDDIRESDARVSDEQPSYLGEISGIDLSLLNPQEIKAKNPPTTTAVLMVSIDSSGQMDSTGRNASTIQINSSGQFDSTVKHGCIDARVGSNVEANPDGRTDPVEQTDQIDLTVPAIRIKISDAVGEIPRLKRASSRMKFYTGLPWNFEVKTLHLGRGVHRNMLLDRRYVILKTGYIPIGYDIGFTLDEEDRNQVAFVEPKSLDEYCGIRAGDIILSANGNSFKESSNVMVLTYLRRCIDLHRHATLLMGREVTANSCLESLQQCCQFNFRMCTQKKVPRYNAIFKNPKETKKRTFKVPDFFGCFKRRPTTEDLFSNLCREVSESPTPQLPIEVKRPIDEEVPDAELSDDKYDEPEREKEVVEETARRTNDSYVEGAAREETSMVDPNGNASLSVPVTVHDAFEGLPDEEGTIMDSSGYVTSEMHDVGESHSQTSVSLSSSPRKSRKRKKYLQRDNFDDDDDDDNDDYKEDANDSMSPDIEPRDIRLIEDDDAIRRTPRCRVRVECRKSLSSTYPTAGVNHEEIIQSTDTFRSFSSDCPFVKPRPKCNPPSLLRERTFANEASALLTRNLHKLLLEFEIQIMAFTSNMRTFVYGHKLADHCSCFLANISKIESVTMNYCRLWLNLRKGSPSMKDVIALCTKQLEDYREIYGIYIGNKRTNLHKLKRWTDEIETRLTKGMLEEMFDRPKMHFEDVLEAITNFQMNVENTTGKHEMGTLGDLVIDCWDVLEESERTVRIKKSRFLNCSKVPMAHL